ncbi:DUF58 domain-containing protein [Pseudomarimonas arenosa]|uniref:DUF58 domain-containing protein n=1 Tax=Pseudomarimonas arenosa TaxID=2774145 RepID=A0AAW3ZIQ9_9GAMM|nr:DUF58 domain-containing protein [Pseudomarimonas arenosa]MBD8525027.1 DUF58 domain-containing protein [Pseudomarimonas arenosa]
MEEHPLQASLAELIALRSSAGQLLRHSRRSSRHLQSGGLHTPFRGRGMEYAESRPYALGDDARHIDWRVSARSGQLHSKLFHPERDRISAVVIESSAAMRFATRGALKLVQAARLASLFVWHAVVQGDRVTVAGFPHALAAQRPTGGERGALRVLHALVECQGRDRQLPTTDDIGLSAALRQLDNQLRTGAHLLLLLDARSLDESAVQRLRGLVRRHDVLACILMDPLEIEALPPGRYPVSLPGSTTLDDARRLQQEAMTRGQQALQELRQLGIRTCAVRTDQPPVEALAGLLSGRSG